MNAIIFECPPSAKRLKFSIPFHAKEWRTQVKQLNTVWYHKQQRLWSIINTEEMLKELKAIFNGAYETKPLERGVTIPKKQLNEASLLILDQIESKIILKGYSVNTQKSYRSSMIKFLCYFENREIEKLTKAEIEGFILKMITKHKISESAQSIMINAIKFYYEHILNKPKEYYNLTRPKKSSSLPNVLSHNEIKAILNAPKNIKHKAILYTIYSGGLRISEVVNLRIEDIHSDDGYIFIKGSKGKKDRQTILSNVTLDLLRKYFLLEKPSYWLFEGAHGGQYSQSSIQKIFRRAVKAANVNPWATVHTLRHSFATHLMMQGSSTRQLQALLGHNSSKTTEIYTHVMNISNKTIVSPLDRILGYDKERQT